MLDSLNCSCASLCIFSHANMSQVFVAALSFLRIVPEGSSTTCLFEGVCNYRHPDPRRVWKVRSEQQSIKMDWLDPVDPVDQLRVPKYGFTSTKPYFSLWESSGGLWGRSRHILLLLRGKKPLRER